MFYQFFGENTLRSDVSVSVGMLGSLLDHTGPIAEGERNAARIFGADQTLFVVGGTSTANKIIWHGMVTKGDLVLCDRNCHKSILHSLIMTGATPIYLIPSRNGLGIIGPISKDQFTPESIQQKVAASPFAKETSGKVRLMVITNSTYDGLCYNIDAIKESLGDSVEVLHFDEAWYAYATFHEFYDGFHAISSTHPERSPHAITFATHSTHKLLAALSQASMIHVQHAQKKQLDMAHFNDAFMMHTSTSPQYGIIASCDVAAAMMEQPAGRALVQETIDEALSFRRAMAAVQKDLKGSWWFEVWQPRPTAAQKLEERGHWVLEPDDKWHGFMGLAENHALVDPIKVTILTPGSVCRRHHAGARHTGIRGDEIPVLQADRDREDRPLLFSRIVLDGHHQGKMEHPDHGATQFQGIVRHQCPAQACFAGAGRSASRRLRQDGPKGFV